MSIKVFSGRECTLNESGQYLKIEANTSTDLKSEQYVSIESKWGDRVELTGITVHDVVHVVLLDCSRETKVLIRDWLADEIIRADIKTTLTS